MDEYKRIDVLKYISDGIKDGILIPILAEKYTRIIARKGVIGETITSGSVNQNGQPIKERESKVGIDSKTGESSWVVTKTDEFGNLIIDNNGHDNSWIIDDSVFRKKYELVDGFHNIYKPISGIQKFVEVNDNIIFNTGSDNDTKIAKGGYINITDLSNIYGISLRDFNDTYKIINIDTKQSKK